MKPWSVTPRQEAVQPSLAALTGLAGQARLLRMPHSPIRAARAGSRIAPFKGRGMEFDETRPYLPGDDVRSLDWKVTARTGSAHTKVFREERERPILVSVDYREGMRFATRGVFKSVQAARLAALLAWAGAQRGDRVGGQLITDGNCLELKPGSGSLTVLRLLNRLSCMASSTDTDLPGTRYPYADALTRLSRHAKPGDLVFLLSDFSDFDEACERRLGVLARHCSICLFVIYDPFEERWPAVGRIRVAQGGRERWLDTGNARARAEHEAVFKDRLERLAQLANRWRMQLASIRTDEDALTHLKNHPVTWR